MIIEEINSQSCFILFFFWIHLPNRFKCTPLHPQSFPFLLSKCHHSVSRVARPRNSASLHITSTPLIQIKGNGNLDELVNCLQENKLGKENQGPVWLVKLSNHVFVRDIIFVQTIAFVIDPFVSRYDQILYGRFWFRIIRLLSFLGIAPPLILAIFGI